MPSARSLFHARALIVGVLGLVLLWAGVLLTPGALEASGYAGLIAAAAATTVLLAATWLGWIDLMSALSLSIDEKAISIGWPTRRVIPFHAVTSLRRSVGTLRLVVGTKSGSERIQLLVDATPPKTLAKLVRAVDAAGGQTEEYLVRLAEYVESTPDAD